MSIVLSLPKTGMTVLINDAAPIKEILERALLLPGTCTDNRRAMRSFQKLVHLESCGDKMIFTHDPGNLQEKVFPRILNETRITTTGDAERIKVHPAEQVGCIVLIAILIGS